MAANGWIQVQDGMWPTILPKSKDVSLDEFSVAVGKFTQDELRIALEHYEEFHELPLRAQLQRWGRPQVPVLRVGWNVIRESQFELAIRSTQRSFACCG